MKGRCHICGEYKKLSFEHIPPKKAFNNRRVVRVKSDDLLELGPDQLPKGRVEQRGSGDYTLCERCNNLTGHWYGEKFVDWCYQAMEILARSRGKPTLYYPYKLYPLRVIKQITTMFLSTNGIDFRDKCPELVEFVLNRNRKYLPPKFRFFIFYNLSSRLRSSGITTAIKDIRFGNIYVFSEITYPPFGYILTIDSEPTEKDFEEISHFANYEYNEFKIQNLQIPVFHIFTWMPGDYRTKEEVLKTYQENIEYEQKRGKRYK